MTAQDGRSTDRAQAHIVNVATGYSVTATVREGRFLVQGLEPGGPYTITLSHPGYHVMHRDGLILRLGEPLEVTFVLQNLHIALDTIHVHTDMFPRANAHGGTGMSIPDSLLHSLPSLDRNLYDFVRLAPQVSTRIGFAGGGMSAGGAGFRYNSFLVDGVSQRTVPGGVPAEFSGLKTVPLHAVREYEVLISPFDVRYGSFTGAVVNAVTRSGTNRTEGSLFVHARTDELSREGAALPYERLQVGALLAGPLWRDRVHFLFASELQRFSAPAPGPYVGQPAGTIPPVPVAVADISRLDTIMRGYGLAAGTGAALENRNPLHSIFVRLDAALPQWHSRAVLWLNDGRASTRAFSRPPRDAFPLTSHETTQLSDSRSAALRIVTAFQRAGGGSNELLASYRTAGFEPQPSVRQPVLRVGVAAVSGGTAELITGTPAHAHGVELGSSLVTIRDEVSLPFGRNHVARFGIDVERFRATRRGLANSYGTWRFSSLDSLVAGEAESYQVSIQEGAAGAPVSGTHVALYAGDEWRGGALVLTGGIRAETLTIDATAPFNPAVDSIFRRSTSQLPRARIHISPRLGFTWTADRTNRLRGGLGVFTGRPPIAWLHAAIYSYGDDVAVLRCGPLPGDLGAAPAFEPAAAARPTACAQGQRATYGTAAVNLLAPDLRLPQVLRGVLAWERRLPAGMTATAEALFSRSLSDYVFVNMNLVGPQDTDRHGRVLYGRFGPTGSAIPTVRSGFSEVIDLRNTSRNRARQLALGLRRTFADGGALLAHYTYSRVRDTQTPLRVATEGTLNWESRAVSGRHDDMSAGISLNDVPHRIVIAAARRAPWKRWSTELSFYYVGESGSPFTYVAHGAGRRGDLNADGSGNNDPIYVPLSAFDTAEIRFSGRSDLPGADNSTAAQAARVATQQRAFEDFVQRSRCLQRQRGRIAARNSCREPWTHTTVATLRQAAPLFGRSLELQIDVYNLLNLLNGDWGLQRSAVQRVLEHVDQSDASQPVFRFAQDTEPWITMPTQSAFQLQLGLRYGF